MLYSLSDSIWGTRENIDFFNSSWTVVSISLALPDIENCMGIDFCNRDLCWPIVFYSEFGSGVGILELGVKFFEFSYDY